MAAQLRISLQRLVATVIGSPGDGKTRMTPVLDYESPSIHLMLTCLSQEPWFRLPRREGGEGDKDTSREAPEKQPHILATPTFSRLSRPRLADHVNSVAWTTRLRLTSRDPTELTNEQKELRGRPVGDIGRRPGVEAKKLSSGPKKSIPAAQRDFLIL